MEVKPPRLAEAVVRWLLPSSCAEHVLGDLQERMQGVEPRAAGRQYVLDAMSLVPSVIFSRLSFNLRVVVVYLLTQFAVFAGIAMLNLRPHLLASLLTAGVLAKIAGYTVAEVALLLVRDNYGTGKKWSLGHLSNVLGILPYFYFSEPLSLGWFLGPIAGEFVVTFARDVFEKHFAGPQGRRTS